MGSKHKHYVYIRKGNNFALEGHFEKKHQVEKKNYFSSVQIEKGAVWIFSKALQILK